MSYVEEEAKCWHTSCACAARDAVWFWTSGQGTNFRIAVKAAARVVGLFWAMSLGVFPGSSAWNLYLGPSYCIYGLSLSLTTSSPETLATWTGFHWV